jgi:hypothetical protein
MTPLAVYAREIGLTDDPWSSLLLLPSIHDHRLGISIDPTFTHDT